MTGRDITFKDRDTVLSRSALWRNVGQQVAATLDARDRVLPHPKACCEVLLGVLDSQAQVLERCQFTRALLVRPARNLDFLP